MGESDVYSRVLEKAYKLEAENAQLKEELAAAKAREARLREIIVDSALTELEYIIENIKRDLEEAVVS